LLFLSNYYNKDKTDQRQAIMKNPKAFTPENKGKKSIKKQ
jgi:hypothetical protein